VSRRLSLLAELQRRHVYKVGAAYAVAGWVLVQVVTQVFPIYEISTHAQRLIVGLIIAGFPVALILAWLFDITPQGIVRTDDVDAAAETPAAAQQRRGADRALNYILGALLLLSLGYSIVERTLLKTDVSAAPAIASSEKSIAVLPFTNTSDDSGNEYFSDGLSEELISSLSRLSHLKVIGRTSSFHFKNQSDDSKTIGEKLGVVYLLEGSVRKSADRVRIAVALVNAADGSNLWSDSYDRELKDVFAVQSEIASAVASQLKVMLLGDNAQAIQAPAADAPTNHNIEAYTALLQGNFYFNREGEADVRTAIGYYSDAIRLDPRYALAYARLSNAQTTLTAGWLQDAEVVAGYQQALLAAHKALDLAPDMSEAHLALARVLGFTDFEHPQAEAEFRQAAALAPAAAEPKLWLGAMLAARGYREQGAALLREALALDPLLIEGYLRYGLTLVSLGHYDEAEAVTRKALALQPSAARLHRLLTEIALARGQPDEALTEAQREPEGFWREYATALALAANPDTAAAKAALQQLINQYSSSGASQIANVYAARRDPDRMFEWLARSLVTRDAGVFWLLLNSPFVMVYKDDPRFVALCKQLGIDPAVAAS
jgi:TolB-like protein/Tfp pilus assembly protein PilF